MLLYSDVMLYNRVLDLTASKCSPFLNHVTHVGR